MNSVALSQSELRSLLQQRRAFIWPELTRASETDLKTKQNGQFHRRLGARMLARCQPGHNRNPIAQRKGLLNAEPGRTAALFPFWSHKSFFFFLKEINMISFFLAPTGRPTAPPDGGGASSHLLSTCFAAIGMMWEELTAGGARPLQGPLQGRGSRIERFGAAQGLTGPVCGHEGHPPEEPTAKQTQRR